VTIFYGYIMQVMALDLIDCDDFFDRVLQLKENEPISYNFEKIGYESVYSIRNFGSLGFAFVIAPVVIILANLIGLCSCETPQKIKHRVNKEYFWNGTIGFINENFILITICWMINLNQFGWDGRGDITNSLFSIFLICLTGGYLVHITFFYKKNYEKIRNRYEYEDFNERHNFVY